MSDPLTDLINDVQHNGVRWVTLVTLYSLFRSERRNYKLDKRDAANFANQHEVMKALGVGDKWKDGPKFGFKPTDLPNLRRFFLLSRKDIIQNPRRKNMLTNLLKANLSKKLISALVAIGVTSLNQKFGLNLSESQVDLVLGLSLAHISLQTVIDSIKAWALGKAKSTVQSLPDLQSAVYKIIADPNTSYAKMVPVISEVHASLTSFCNDMQKGKVTEATREAMSAYLTFQAYLQTIKPTPPIEVPTAIPSAEKVGA